MRRPPLFRRSALALGFVALTACGGSDGPTGPSATFSPVGTWAFNISNAKADDITCSVTGYTVTFTESNGILGGSISTGSGATISCLINGSTQSITSNGSGSLTSASRSGSTINFGYTTTSGPSSMTGTIENDNRMSGTGTIRLSFSGTPRPFNGTWVATRK